MQDDILVTLAKLIQTPLAQPGHVRWTQALNALAKLLGEKVSVKADLGQNALAVFQHFH
jgi:hypothetical protein